LVKYENYEKRWQGTQIEGPIFTNAGDNTLLCFASLTEYIKQSTQNEIEYLEWSTYIEQSTQNEIEYVKWSTYIEQSTQNEIENVKWSTYIEQITQNEIEYPTITYYWTVPLILDQSDLVGKSTSSKIADTEVSGF
jgi:hypothetical protein